jgi:hypothetical protein
MPNASVNMRAGAGGGGEDGERMRRGILYTVGGNVNSSSPYGNQYGGSSKTTILSC